MSNDDLSTRIRDAASQIDQGIQSSAPELSKAFSRIARQIDRDAQEIERRSNDLWEKMKRGTRRRASNKAL